MLADTLSPTFRLALIAKPPRGHERHASFLYSAQKGARYWLLPSEPCHITSATSPAGLICCLVALHAVNARYDDGRYRHKLCFHHAQLSRASMEGSVTSIWLTLLVIGLLTSGDLRVDARFWLHGHRTASARRLRAHLLSHWAMLTSRAATSPLMRGQHRALPTEMSRLFDAASFHDEAAKRRISRHASAMITS